MSTIVEPVSVKYKNGNVGEPCDYDYDFLSEICILIKPAWISFKSEYKDAKH